ncbi:hypothetical protein FNYG_15771 [Fusarium nygamai]|uniref:Uncharacterized protein n=1 Tax=Gibberella nygamai TaxID=42673 RepID=A0A2K0U646_GIBNY|nr:hypothetical protein FNYG_15771 [Fusarium nygamai]
MLASKSARKSAPGRVPRPPPDKSLTPLHHAAIGGKPRILNVLLRTRQAAIEKEDGRGRTPLHHAVINGRPEAVKILLAHKASVAAKDKDSFTPLLLAAQGGQLEILGLLLDNGALVSTSCSMARTPLHHAIMNGYTEITKVLLDNGIPLKSQDVNGRIALDYAIYRRHWDIVELLLKEGRRRWVSLQLQPEGANIPVVATVDNKAVISILKREAKPHPQLPLEVTARLGREDLVHEFFNVHGCCLQGPTPLYLAVESGNPRCVEILLSCGADVNASCSTRKRPLDCALRLRHDIIAGILPGAGAEPPDWDFRSLESSPVVLLATRGPSVAAGLLSHIQSLNTLSIWLVKIAKFKHVDIIQEYFRAVVPNLPNRYMSQLGLRPSAKLVQYLIQSQRTSVSGTKPGTRASASHSLETQRTIVAALQDQFDGVFFLVSIVEPEILRELLASVPGMLEEAVRRLPSYVNRPIDRDLIICLSKAGYTLPTPHPCPLPPPLASPPPPSAKEHILYDMCETGSIAKVQARLQEMVGDVNEVGPRSRTPLHTAAQQGHLGIVKLLVDHGADLEATTSFGSTAEDLAKNYNEPLVAAFLKAARQEQYDRLERIKTCILSVELIERHDVFDTEA